MTAGLLLGVAVAFGTMVFSSTAAATMEDSPPPPAGLLDPAKIDRGRYLTKIAGCNDCHTRGYAESAGNVAESAWLSGDALGWRGPWGTTYAANLRQLLSALSEDQWVHLARHLRSRPPMPWFQLRDMSDADLSALYHFVVSLGPNDTPVPAFVPPDREPLTPYVQFPAQPAQ